MNRDLIIGVLSLAFVLTMAGVNPVRALAGSAFGVMALGCMLGAGLSWLTECCPESKYLPPTVLGIVFAGLTVTAFVI